MKAYTDIEQSEKLAKILSRETSDLWYSYYGNSKYNPTFAYKGEQWFLSKDMNGIRDIPCWSLAALLNVLPKIHNLKPLLDLEGNLIMYSGLDIDVSADNIIDACVEMLIKLHELKML